MKNFPDQLRPENRSEFAGFRRRRALAYLRRHILEGMLQPSFGPKTEQDPDKSYGIDLTNVDLGRFVGGYTVDQNLLTTVCQELEELGWETNISYGGSMLFIYPPGEKPSEALNISGFE
jgi:hypothetical protein